MSDLYVAHHEGLVTVHRALMGAFDQLYAGLATDALVPGARQAAGFLLAHHQVEDTLLFPALRRHGRLRSTDAAFLDACDEHHHALHDLAERLASCTGHAEIVALGRETAARLRAHTADEEAGLSPERLREMIDEASLSEVGRQMEAMRRARVAPAP